MSATNRLDILPLATVTTHAETLNRSLSFWNSLTIGFAVVSPVVGLYAIIGVQIAVTAGLIFRTGALSGDAVAGGHCLCRAVLAFSDCGGAYKCAR